jgi:hypothetical protein
LRKQTTSPQQPPLQNKNQITQAAQNPATESLHYNSAVGTSRNAKKSQKELKIKMKEAIESSAAINFLTRAK